MFHRLGALIQKEFTQLLRDRQTMALVLMIPLAELLTFAYAVDMSVDHVPTVVVDLSMDVRSRAFLAALTGSGVFSVVAYAPDEDAALRMLERGEAKVAVVIPPGLAAAVERGDAQVLVVLDGSDSFSVQAAYGAVQAIAQEYALEVMEEQLNRQGMRMNTAPIETTTRVLYNPTMDDLVFILPGLVAMVLQVLSVSLTAQSVVREYELGTMEQLLITPARPLELVVSKLVPNVVISLVDMAIITLAGVYWFGVPFRGNAVLFVWLSLLYISSGLGLGLLISTVAQTQREAQQLSAALMLFSMLLTGFIYPREPMPVVVRLVGNAIPLTYFMRIVRGIVTKGVGMAFFWEDVVALGVYSVVVLGAAARLFRGRLD